MATSTIPAFTAALLAQLQARPGLNGVQIVDGAPTAPQQDMIVLGDVDGDQMWAALGQLAREETYTLTVYVSAVRTAGSQVVASTAALAYAAEIETELRANVTMNQTVRTCELETPWKLSKRAISADQREAQVTLGIYCTARI